jgi:hypothetical protein
MAPPPASPPLTKESYPSQTKVGIRSRTNLHLTVKSVIAIIVDARIADFGHILISMKEASGMVFTVADRALRR